MEGPLVGPEPGDALPGLEDRRRGDVPKGEGMNEPKITAFTCSAMGVAPTTKAYVRRTETGFEARMGVSVMGTANMILERLERMTPFDPKFHDNWVSGGGATEGEALAKMKDDMEALSRTLFL